MKVYKVAGGRAFHIWTFGAGTNRARKYDKGERGEIAFGDWEVTKLL